MTPTKETDPVHWFVLRDLKRPNAKEPAYRQLAAADVEVFTPMRWQLRVRDGKRIREQVPFIRDLLFVHAARSVVDPYVERTPTLQYRYCKGGGYRNPMTVPDGDMERFIRAVALSANPVYYLPEELTEAMLGRPVRIVGGSMDGYTGRLLSLRGARTRRLLVELPGFFAAGVEVENEYVEFLKEE